MSVQDKVLIIVALVGLYVFVRIRWLRRKWRVTQAKLAAERAQEKGQ